MTETAKIVLKQTSVLPSLLALVVVSIWGTNFVVIKFGLDSFPPFEFAFLRFVFVFFPASLLLPKPHVSWKKLATYGLFMGGGQFGLLYLAMDGHISAGLASLVIQVQVFFTIALALLLSGEKLTVGQSIAISIAALGFLIIAFYGSQDATPYGLALVILAGLSWAIANLVVRRIPPGEILHFVVWSSPFALIPLLGMLVLENNLSASIHAIRFASLASWLALAWQSVANTLFGFALWGWLLARFTAARIAPMGLLVPIFGIATSGLILGERLQPWKCAGASLIIFALVLNALAARTPARKAGATD